MLKITSVTKSFDGDKTFAVDSVSFQLEKGKNYAIVGESGSGKTTLTRLITGLEKPSYGEIELNDELVNSDTTFIAPEKRKVGMVFQDYALFPHLSVFENIAYGLDKGFHKNDRVAEVLGLVGLQGFEKRYPHQLSGGQQQRVALARAIAPKPSLLILDEPFSNLDASLRNELRNELFSIIKKANTTTIFVTHDTEDALAVADEVLVLRNGKLLQKGSTKRLYYQPTTEYVASLFGEVLCLENTLLKQFDFLEQDKIYIRRESLRINQPADFTTKAMVLNKKFMGANYELELKIGENILLLKRNQLFAGTEVTIGFDREATLAFN